MKINIDGSIELTVEEFNQLAPRKTPLTISAPFTLGQPVPAFEPPVETPKAEILSPKKWVEKEHALVERAKQELSKGQFDVWELLWDSRKNFPDGWLLSEIAETLQRRTGTVYGQLAALRKKEFVEKDATAHWRVVR